MANLSPYSAGPTADLAESVCVSMADLRTLALAVCRAAGLPEDHAALQVDLLIEADLRGRASHGLMRLPRIVERIANGVADPRATGRHSVRGALLAVDGEMGLGPVVGMRAVEAMAARLDETGVAAAAIFNNNHLGMLAWYAERVAAEGNVLLAMGTSEALVHPWGGRRAMLGTNPIAIGIPTADGPFVIDMATSLVAMGTVHDYASRGRPLKAGWALDENGEPTVDAARAKVGSLAPFGEAKGYVLGLAIEMLVTSVTNAAIGRDVAGTLDSDRICNKGDLFVMLKPSADRLLLGRLSAFLDAVRHSGGDKAVLVPGDRASAARKRALGEGVSLPAALHRRLKELAGEKETR